MFFKSRIIIKVTYPLIMAKESAELKIDDPGIIVTVSFPALIISASSSPFFGYAPYEIFSEFSENFFTIPKSPFSLCNEILIPLGI